MADPLHNKDYRDFHTRVSSSAGTGLDENRGKTMPYQAPLHDPIRKGAMSADRDLLLEREGHLAFITINRATARNSFTYEMYTRMAAVCAGQP